MGKSFLSQENLFASLHNEIASLIKLAFVVVVDGFLPVFVVEFTPLRFQHYWEGCQLDFIKAFPWSDLSILINLSELESHLDEGFVVEVSGPACVGINFLIFPVLILVVDGGPEQLLFEFELIADIAQGHLADLVLFLDLNDEGPMIADDFTDVLGEPVIRVDLLIHQSILAEVHVQDFPHLLTLNLLSFHQIQL